MGPFDQPIFLTIKYGKNVRKNMGKDGKHIGTYGKIMRKVHKRNSRLSSQHDRTKW